MKYNFQMKKTHVSSKFIQRQKHAQREIENGKEVVKSKNRSVSVYKNEQIKSVVNLLIALT